jgi:dTDP-4-amino-4,6-dideoxygalactose transaminase
MKTKLFKPYVSYRAIFNVVKVLLGTQLAEGEQVKAFEHEFGNVFGLKNVVAVNSGTSALELAYELAGIKKGSEVITPVLTCTATNIPLVRRQAKIVFADIDYDLNINIEDVKKKLTPRTKAIVFVHFGGNPRGLTELRSLCDEYQIPLIEDAAQAVGNGCFGMGDYTCVSLQAIKTLTSGDGGFLICKSGADALKAKRLRWFGYDREEKQKKGDTDLTEAGYKYHMNDITAAIGRGNLKTLPKILKKRAKLRAFYNSIVHFTGMSSGDALDLHFLSKWLSIPSVDMKFKRLSGVECHNWLAIQWGKKGEQHHYRNDKYTLFKKFKNDCPVMDELENEWRLLPFHHDVTIKQAKNALSKP